MIGYHSSEGYRVEPLDDRDEDPGYEINPILSSPDFQFSEDDPAIQDPAPKEPMAPAWNTEERNET